MAESECPVCGSAWQTIPTRCSCGFDFTTGSAQVAVDALMIRKRDARRRWLIGAAIVLTIPLLILIGGHRMPMFWPVLAVQVISGSGLAGTGLLREVAVLRQLAAANALGQLPAARVIK